MISFAHHSYLIIGDRQAAVALIKKSITANLGLELVGYPDFYLADHDLFGVDDSRELKQRINARAFGGGRKFFLISIGSTSAEAQNALLKVLEEPAGEAHIFIIARSAKIFLPTVLSRCELVLVSDSEVLDSTGWPEFLIQSPAQRLKTITDWHKADQLSKEFLGRLLDDIERAIVAQANRSGLSALVQARRYIYDRALLPKMVLEYLAVALPQFSKTKWWWYN